MYCRQFHLFHLYYLAYFVTSRDSQSSSLAPVTLLFGDRSSISQIGVHGSLFCSINPIDFWIAGVLKRIISFYIVHGYEPRYLSGSDVQARLYSRRQIKVRRMDLLPSLLPTICLDHVFSSTKYNGYSRLWVLLYHKGTKTITDRLVQSHYYKTCVTISSVKELGPNVLLTALSS